jgi:subfamily B ATP-binding cassette protein MsbA
VNATRAGDAEQSGDLVRGAYRRILGYCRPYIGVFALGAFAMIVFALTYTGYAFLIRNLIDALQAPESGLTDIQRWLPLVVLGLFLVRGVAGFFAIYNLGWIGRKVIKRLREEVFGKYLQLPTSYYDRHSGGNLLSVLTFNIEQIAEATTTVITVAIRDSFTIIGLVGYMVYLSPRLAALVFAVAPVIVLLVRYLGGVFRRYSGRIQNSMGDVTRIAEETIQGNKVVKVFNGQDYEGRRFDGANEDNRRMNMRLYAARAAGDSVTIFVAALGVSLVVYFLTQESARQTMNLGTISGFISAMVLLMTPLKRLTSVNVSLQRGVAAAKSVFEVLDAEVEKDTGTLVGGRISGNVKFRSVDFTYSAEKGAVLRDIDLSVASGETLAIVGRSGSGKSTLVSLIPRFYDPESGEILIDGTPISEFSLAHLRDQISLVSQEVTLFNDTIANNIAYGSLAESARQDIENAARAAHVIEFAGDFPDGLETLVGDRGVLLSGGQRQRIAIARALLKNAPILILDEATSALDTESERHIQAALGELMANRTTLVIAHRLSTVENADRIVVMAEGRIVEAGSHQELLALNGHYATLHRLQFQDDVGR